MALTVRSDDPALEFLAAPDKEPTLDDFASFLRSVGEIVMVPRLANGGSFPGSQSFHPTQILPKSMDFITYNGLLDHFSKILVDRNVDEADAFRVAVLGNDWELRYEYLEDGCHLQGRCNWKPDSSWIDTGLSPEDEALASLSFTCQMISHAQGLRCDSMHDFALWMDEQRGVCADMAMRLIPFGKLDIETLQTIEWVIRDRAMDGATGYLQELPGDWAVDALRWEPGASNGAGLWACRVVRRTAGKADLEVSCRPKADPAHAVMTCALLAEIEIERERREASLQAFHKRFAVADVGPLTLVVPR